MASGARWSQEPLSGAAPSVTRGSHGPGTWHELAWPQPPTPSTYRGLGSLCPKQQPFRGGQEKLPGGKSPPGSGPPRSHPAACTTLAAGATTAGAAASAGARHKGRLCSRSPGCLPRAILLAPGRLPAPAAHTRAFHEGSGDDLLPGGRGRGGRTEPQHASAQLLVLQGPTRVSEAEGLAGGHLSPHRHRAEWIPLLLLPCAGPFTDPSARPWGHTLSLVPHCI